MMRSAFLQGTIPPGWDALAESLHILDLSNNHITGEQVWFQLLAQRGHCVLCYIIGICYAFQVVLHVMHLSGGHATSQRCEHDAGASAAYMTFRLRLYAFGVISALCAGATPTNLSTMVPVLHLEYNNFQAAPQTWFLASHNNSSKWYLRHISMQVGFMDSSGAQEVTPSHCFCMMPDVEPHHTGKP